MSLFTIKETKVKKAFDNTSLSLNDTYDKLQKLGNILSNTYHDKLVIDQKFQIYSRATHEAIVFISFDGTIIDYNKPCADMFEIPYKEDDLLGKGKLHIRDFIPSIEDQKKVLKNISENNQGEYEYEILTSSRTRLNIKASGFNTEYKNEMVRVSTIVDITNMVKLEKENRLMRKKLGQLLIQYGYTNNESLDDALVAQHGLPRLLGNILLDMKVITLSQLTEALSRQHESHLGRILVNMNIITEEQLHNALEAQNQLNT